MVSIACPEDKDFQDRYMDVGQEEGGAEMSYPTDKNKIKVWRKDLSEKLSKERKELF